MIVFDTNVLSEVMRTDPNISVANWMMALPATQVATTSICEAEVLWGIHQLPKGRKRAELAAAAKNAITLFSGRILPFDSIAAPDFADIMETRQRAGRRVGEMDAMIAAIARSRGYVLATRNTVDFTDIGLELVNPWDHAITRP